MYFNDIFIQRCKVGVSTLLKKKPHIYSVRATYFGPRDHALVQFGLALETASERLIKGSDVDSVGLCDDFEGGVDGGLHLSTTDFVAEGVTILAIGAYGGR